MECQTLDMDIFVQEFLFHVHEMKKGQNFRIFTNMSLIASMKNSRIKVLVYLLSLAKLMVVKLGVTRHRVSQLSFTWKTLKKQGASHFDGDSKAEPECSQKSSPIFSGLKVWKTESLCLTTLLLHQNTSCQILPRVRTFLNMCTMLLL